MKTIIIGFSRPKKFKLHAWFIMKLDRVNFDHAYLRFHSGNFDREIIYQAIGKGVQFIGNNLFQSINDSIEEYEIEIDQEQHVKLMQFCIDNSGIPYGLLQVLGVGLVKLLSRVHITISNPFGDGLKTEFCDEIIGRCLNQINKTEFDYDFENLTPSDLKDILVKSNIKRIL